MSLEVPKSPPTIEIPINEVEGNATTSAAMELAPIDSTTKISFRRSNYWCMFQPLVLKSKEIYNFRDIFFITNEIAYPHRLGVDNVRQYFS